jgi:hypothetical protein
MYLPSKHAAIPDDVSLLMTPISDAAVSERVYVKKIKKTTSAILYLALSDAPSLEALLQAKRDLAAHNIRRTKRLPFIADVSTMYGLLNSKTLLDLGVDGLLFNLSKLAAAYHPGSSEPDAELFKLVNEALTTLKKQKLSFIGLALSKEYFTLPLRKELQPLIKNGVNALVFTEPIPHATPEDIRKMEDEVMGAQLG